MRSLVLRVLLCSAALNLASPPGWCCTAAMTGRAPAAPSFHACCARPLPVGQRAPAPAVPTRACCCQADGTPAPPRERSAADPAPLFLATVPGEDLRPACAGLPAAEGTSFVSSPPLHVLHCLWCC